MAYTYTTRNGQRVQTNVAAAFDRLNTAFRNRFGLNLLVSSGTRTNAEQWHLYNLYKAGKGNLAAYPGTSNHEENGPAGPRALDVRDSGSDAGVTVRGTTRANWLRANAPAYGFNPAGYGFSQIEPWHIEYTGSLNGGGSSGGSGKLIVDGLLGFSTIKFLQKVLGVIQDGKWGFNTTLALQKKLNAIGYNLTLDGDLGPATIKALQTYILGHKKADGKIGPETIRGLQNYLNSGGTFPAKKPTPKPTPSAKLDVDGNWGYNTNLVLQGLLKVKPADGKFGPITRKALQVALNAKPFDGQAGPITNKALQTFLKQGGYYTGNIDGEIGVESIKGLQRFLNTGKPFTHVVVDNVPTPPPPPVVSSPAKQVTPILPFAKEGWDTPRGRESRDKGSVIKALAIHHTGTTNDNLNYFKQPGNGSVPTWYTRPNGDIFEMTRPGLRPVTTANSNNWTVSIETQNTTNADGGWKVSDESIEKIAQIAAWLHSYNGKTLDGIPVEFTLDREHIKGHREFEGNNTQCPGDYLYGKLDYIVDRAKEIYKTDYAPTKPLEPETPEGYTLVKTSTLKNIQTHLKALQIVVDNLIGEK